jgi:hypothetical protein
LAGLEERTAGPSPGPIYEGTLTGLARDDVDGIQAIYGARPADSANNSFANATDLSGLIDPVALTAQANDQQLATPTSADYFTFTAPEGSNSTIRVQVQSQGLSLLAPVLTVYASDQHTVLGYASGANKYGATLTVTLNNVTAGQTYYVKVNGTSSPANTGAYALTLNLGTGDMPEVTLPNTQTPNGDPISGGGGLPQLAGDDGDGPAVDRFRPARTPVADPSTAADVGSTAVRQAALLAATHFVPAPAAALAAAPGLAGRTAAEPPLPAALVVATSASTLRGGTATSSAAGPEATPAPDGELSARREAAPPHSRELFLAGPAAVWRLRGAHGPAVASRTAEGPGAPVLGEGEAGLPEAGLLLAAAPFLGVTGERQPLNRCRSARRRRPEGGTR